MNFQTPVLFLIASMLSPPALAYQFEVIGAYQDSRFSSGPDSFGTRQERDSREAGVEYFFGGIDDTGGPLAEAAFLSPASSVALQVVISDGERGFSNGGTFQIFDETDSEQFIASARYFHGPSRWLFELDYSKSNQDTRFINSPEFRGRDDTHGVRVGLGRYVGESSLVGVHLRGARLTNRTGSTQIGFPSSSSDTDFWEVGLSAKTLFGIGKSLAYGVEAQAVGFRSQTNSSTFGFSSDDSWFGRLSAKGSVFFGRERSIALNVDTTVGPLTVQSTTATLAGQWFVRDNVALGAGYSTVFYDDDSDFSVDPDFDRYFLEVVWRFGGQ